MWLVSREEPAEVPRLEMAGIPYRFSYDFDIDPKAEPYAGYNLRESILASPPFAEMVQEFPFSSTDEVVKGRIGEMAAEEDGYCKVCGADFRDGGIWCSSECRDDLFNTLPAEVLGSLPRCANCDVHLAGTLPSEQVSEKYSLPKIRKPMEHHIDYEQDETVLVCTLCHAGIHHSSDREAYGHLEPRDERPEQRRPKTKLVQCANCLGRARVSIDYKGEGALCYRCKQKVQPKKTRLVPCSSCDGQARIPSDNPREKAECYRCRRKRPPRRSPRQRRDRQDGLRAKFADRL